MKQLLYLTLGVSLFVTACNDKDVTPPVTKRFAVTIENVSAAKMFIQSGVINTPVGNASPGPLTPGKKYEFIAKAGKGQKLSFAVMLAATNDLFFAPDDNGIALYDNNGNPVSGDITSMIYLYDAGTEINEEPAVGPNTVTNQTGPNTGPAENAAVRPIGQVTTDMFAYPAVNQVLKASVQYMSDYNFKVTIENVSTSSTLKTSKGNFAAPISPGVWVVHMDKSPLFTLGQKDRGKGLEAIAEDGNPTALGTFAAANTGLIYPLSPGVWATHKSGVMPIFKTGAVDFGKGLEAIAEDGDPSKLATALQTMTGVLMSGAFKIPDGATQPAPLGPGMKYTFTFTADENEYLSFATMFVQSNDLFYAPPDQGIMLFNNGVAVSGDITPQISLWDAGTEKNEEPGFGPNQVQRQSAANTGMPESNPVQKVGTTFTYPATNQVIKVTVTSN